MTKTHSRSDSLCPRWCIASSLATIPASLLPRTPDRHLASEPYATRQHPHTPRMMLPRISLSLRQDMTSGFGGVLFVCTSTLIHDRQNALMGGEPREICLRPDIWGATPLPPPPPPREYEWSREINALFLSVCVIYSHFIQWAHSPRGFSVRPGKRRVRAAPDEYDCPLCLPPMPYAKKSAWSVMPFWMVRVNL